MRYCVSGRQSKSVMEKADEIRFQYKDLGRAFDYLEVFTDKTFIIDIPKDTEIDWNKLKMYADKVDLILALADLKLAGECYVNQIKFYWVYPITTWYELRGIVELNPCYLFLGAPLSFSLSKVKECTDIPIRLCANLAYDAYIPRKEGICGQWIRPEDVDTYGAYVSAIDFVTNSLDSEKTLLDVYKFDKTWPGNLNLIITNLNYNVDNRLIPEDLGATRMNCGQRCMDRGTCHLCDNGVKFANKVRDGYYAIKRKQRNQKTGE